MKKVVLTMIATMGLSSGAAFAKSAPSGAFVDSIQIIGSGCLRDYIEGYQLGPNHLGVKTPSFHVALEQNSRIERKNCQAMIDIVKPDGWTYRVTRVRLNGWAHVSGNVEARVTNSHYIQGQARSSLVEQSISPWFRNNFRFINDEKGEWAPCGVDRILNVNTAIMVRRGENGKGHAYLKLNPNMRVQLEWKRC